MLGQPIETPLDFEFMLLRFPVRVSALFWLTAIVLGFGWIQAIDALADSPGRGALLGMWCFAVFISILIHELGHALAFRQCGIQASIVLYHFGGLAIPVGSMQGNFFSQRSSALQDLWIASAGPLAQLGLAAFVAMLTMAFGYEVPGMEGLSDLVGVLSHLKPIENTTMRSMIMFIVFPSVFWAFFNLLPVFPLDGGRITHALDRQFFRTDQHAMMLSLVVAGIVGAWGLTHRQLFLGIFFISFAISNYESLYGHGNRWR